MKILRILCVALAFSLVASLAEANTASATLRTIRIKQVNPNGAAHAITCKDSIECNMTIKISSEKTNITTINITITLEPTGVALSLMSNSKYFYISNSYYEHGHRHARFALDKSKNIKGNIYVFLPPTPTASQNHLNDSLALKSRDDYVAQLEIRVSPAE
jgi:hypothetical protein